MGGSAVSSGTDLSADVYEPGTDDLLETQAKLQVAVQTLIAGIGEDLQRDGLRDTPKVGADCIVGRVPILGKPYSSPQSRDILSTMQRVAKAWLDASSGYRKTAKRWNLAPAMIPCTPHWPILPFASAESWAWTVALGCCMKFVPHDSIVHPCMPCG